MLSDMGALFVTKMNFLNINRRMLDYIKSKRIWGVLGYILCIIIGGVFSFMIINLPSAKEDKPVVDVKVHVPEPTVIHDTVIQPEIKYKYIYRNSCCCGNCISDTINKQ